MNLQKLQRKQEIKDILKDKLGVLLNVRPPRFISKLLKLLIGCKVQHNLG